MNLAYLFGGAKQVDSVCPKPWAAVGWGIVRLSSSPRKILRGT